MTTFAHRLRVGRWHRDPILVAAAVVCGHRLLGLTGWGTSVAPPGFDEGAYFSSAALWARGWALHGEFVAVHPPGTTYVLAPLTYLGTPSTALGIARVAMALVGGASALLVGRIAARALPTWAAVGAIAVYLALPDVAAAERSIVIEPLLNLACLLVAWTWLTDRPAEESDRRALLTGLALGAAVLFKAWAALMLVPIVATAPVGRRVRVAVRVVGAASTSAAVLALPVVLRAPHDFWVQVIAFQADRRDGAGGTLVERVERILPVPTDLTLVRTSLFGVVVVGAAIALARRTHRDRRVTFALVWLATVSLVFVASPIHDMQYNAHLAPAASIVAAWAITACVDAARRAGALPVRAVGAATLVGLVAMAAFSLDLARNESLNERYQPWRVAEVVRPLPRCVYSFEAGWLIAADRLPDPSVGGPSVVDPYVSGLIAANAAGDGDLLLGAPAAQRLFRDAVSRCDTVVMGERGNWHLGPSMAWFRARFRQVQPPVWEGGPDVWVRTGSRRR